MIKCPFYSASLTPNFGLVASMGGSNRCALIVSAHSPCWMSAFEGRQADWADCPRNPEFVAANVWRGDPDAGEEARRQSAADRIVAAITDLNTLIHIKGLAQSPAGDVPA